MSIPTFANVHPLFDVPFNNLHAQQAHTRASLKKPTFFKRPVVVFLGSEAVIVGLTVIAIAVKLRHSDTSINE